MKKIKLTKGYYTIVDDNWYKILILRKWCADPQHINSSKQRAIAGCKSGKILMSRFIMNAVAGECVDHINGNTLDNRVSNLRKCTHLENCRNQTKVKTRNLSSKYKGVCFDKQKNKFVVHIRYNNHPWYLGCYNNEAIAAKKYDEFAKYFYGEYANTNFKNNI